jgi:hypothetical protein
MATDVSGVAVGGSSLLSIAGGTRTAVGAEVGAAAGCFFSMRVFAAFLPAARCFLLAAAFCAAAWRFFVSAAFLPGDLFGLISLSSIVQVDPELELKISGECKEKLFFST